jgi:hypothetical protein
MAEFPSGMQKLSVFNPVGYPPNVSAKSMAPRLGSLDGKLFSW